MRALFRSFWADAGGYQRLAYLVGAGLVVIGLAHAAMWALAGGSASGPLSWRKPTTFGISFGRDQLCSSVSSFPTLVMAVVVSELLERA